MGTPRLAGAQRELWWRDTLVEQQLQGRSQRSVRARTALAQRWSLRTTAEVGLGTDAATASTAMAAAAVVVQVGGSGEAALRARPAAVGERLRGCSR